jgi:putative hydrolase of the HAD superfamily
VVFDAVGTLIHPEPPVAEIYAEVGRTFGSRLVPAMVAPRFARAFSEEEAVDRAAGLRTSEVREQERWQRIVCRVLDDVADPEGCFSELFEHFGRPKAWRWRAETATVLESLTSAGYRLAVASNYDARLRRVVAGLPALGLISRLVICSEVGWRKPAPEFFHAVSKEVGLPPEQVLYVGDHVEMDYQGARAAGLHAVLLDPGGNTHPGIDRVRALAALLDSSATH